MNTHTRMSFRTLSAAGLLLAVASVARADRPVPDLDLRDSGGNRVARVRLYENPDQCRVRIRTASLKPGRYTVRLGRAAKCYFAKTSQSPVSETVAFEVLGDGSATVTVVLPGIRERGGLLRLLAESGLVLETLPADGHGARSCGTIERWYSFHPRRFPGPATPAPDKDN